MISIWHIKSQSLDKSALAKFNLFLKEYNLPSTSDPQLKERLSKELYGQFASYLKEVKTQTATFYISLVQRFLIVELGLNTFANIILQND